MKLSYNQEQINSMISTCYEIEGLLQVMLSRGDNTPEQLVQLLNQKIDQLSNGLNKESDDKRPKTEAVTIDNQEIATALQYEQMEDSDPLPSEIVTHCQAEQNTDKISTISINLTLNDKFRFKKELFANDQAEFDDAIGVISSMSSSEEVEDYLFNDLCFDENNPVVKEFISAITQSK